MIINKASINSNTINAEAAGTVDATEDVLETAVITSIANPNPTFAATETAVITSAVTESVIATQDVLETAVIVSSEAIQVVSDLISEAAVITDTVYPSANRLQDTEETAVITSAVALSATSIEDIAETAVITDSVTQSNPEETITETAVITSGVALSATSVLDVAETAVITSSTAHSLPEDVTDTAVITSAIAPVSIELDVLETAVITSATTLEATERWDVLETAVVSAVASHTLTAIEDILEEAFISSAVAIDGADVWTANTINWAMSTYTGLTMTGAAGQYAVSEDGLFSKAASYANMNLSTGHADMGSANLKNVPYAYTYAEHTAPMCISVTADVLGTEHTEKYTQMARDASDTRAVRCTFGRGFRSSYYKLNFTSSGYAQVRSCLPVVDELSRRI